jgi:hypothetical protein
MTQSVSSLPTDLPIMHEVSRQIYPVSALYVLATPIGNVGDITLRALHVLSIVDAIACEDTRNTGHLLARYGLSKNFIAAHQHNEREVADKLIARLQAGERIALVSDAGTPAISDPGARIVDAVRAAAAWSTTSFILPAFCRPRPNSVTLPWQICEQWPQRWCFTKRRTGSLKPSTLWRRHSSRRGKSSLHAS